MLVALGLSAWVQSLGKKNKKKDQGGKPPKQPWLLTSTCLTSPLLAGANPQLLSRPSLPPLTHFLFVFQGKLGVPGLPGYPGRQGPKVTGGVLQRDGRRCTGMGAAKCAQPPSGRAGPLRQQIRALWELLC